MTHNAPGEMIQRPRILRVCASAPTPASKPCFKPKGIYLYSNIARVLTDQIPHVFSAFSSFVPLASVSVNDMQPPQKVNEQDACMSIYTLAGFRCVWRVEGKPKWSAYKAFGTLPRLIYVSMKSWISNCSSKNDMKNFLGISCLSPLHNEWPLINQQIQHDHGLSTILTSQDAHLDTGESREVVKRTVRRVASLLHPHVAAVQEHSQIGR